MSILKYKYKAHKLVNTLFYVAVFGIGFLLGFGTNKIDFNKLVSQVLMIDSVKAYNITSTTNSSDSVNEEFIINAFEDLFDTFNYSEVPYITCSFTTNFPLICIAMNENLFNSLYIYNSSTATYGIAHNAVENATYYRIRISSGLSYSVLASVVNTDLNALTNNTIFNINTQGSGYTKWKTFANFNPSDIDSKMTSLNSKVNLLDFSKYAIPEMIYNENLFKDNPDFKEVCVPNNKKFGIISKEYNTDENITDETLNNRYYVDRDYIWFPNGVKGLSTFFYHNKSENNVKVIDKDDASYSMYGYWYWLNSKEEIDKYFGELPTSAMLSEAGYTDKYKYYNYTMHPFLIRYIGYEDDYMFNVFWFKELGVNYIDSDIVDYPEDYCFYIKNKYDVVLLNTNEWGDLYTDITILGDKDITISTSQNESDVNNVGIFSVVNNFIYQIKGTIIFINTNIHNLFLAMPLIVRMFILSVLTVFIIKFIIDMIVR